VLIAVAALAAVGVVGTSVSTILWAPLVHAV
jgi:hypothetical protein